MIHEDCQHQDQILATLALTAKIQKNLKHLVSHSKSKPNSSSNQEELESSEEFNTLKVENHKLRAQNKELHNDNEQLCREIVKLKKQKQTLKRDLAERKESLTYLENVCKELKKQLLFWMSKPKKKEMQTERTEPTVSLMVKVAQLKRNNDVKQKELQNLKKGNFFQAHTPQTPHTMKINRNSSMYNYCESVNGHKQNTSSVNQCASCHYKVRQKPTAKGKGSSSSKIKSSKAKKALCSCHQRYVKTRCFEE